MQKVTLKINVNLLLLLLLLLLFLLLFFFSLSTGNIIIILGPQYYFCYFISFLKFIFLTIYGINDRKS